MKRLLLVAVMCLTAIAAPFAMSAGKMDAVNVCHNGRALSVNGNAVSGHQVHGDWVIDAEHPCPAVEGGGA